MDCKAMKVQLNSGHYMRLIGFGTYQIHGRPLTKDVLNHVLAAGYRHLDTADMYGNEEDIGAALKELLPKHNLKREDIFITSKLSPGDQGDSAFAALEGSVKKLDCGYLDLYLIHWPGTYGVSSGRHDNAKLRALSWDCLIKGVEKGLVRDIGVSNYTVRHLEELMSKSSKKPSVNQVEWHPHCHQSDLKEFCEKEGIVLEAYSSLGGTKNRRLMSESVVAEIAKEMDRTTAQILLRWAVQQNVAIIPRSRSKEHIESNMDLDFVISEENMKKLSSLKTKVRYDWDPTTVA